jgi:hypothetical protein
MTRVLFHEGKPQGKQTLYEEMEELLVYNARALPLQHFACVTCVGWKVHRDR